MSKQTQKRWGRNHRRMTDYGQTPGATFDDRKWYALVDEMADIMEHWADK